MLTDTHHSWIFHSSSSYWLRIEMSCCTHMYPIRHHRLHTQNHTHTHGRAYVFGYLIFCGNFSLSRSCALNTGFSFCYVELSTITIVCHWCHCMCLSTLKYCLFLLYRDRGTLLFFYLYWTWSHSQENTSHTSIQHETNKQNNAQSFPSRVNVYAIFFLLLRLL